MSRFKTQLKSAHNKLSEVWNVICDLSQARDLISFQAAQIAYCMLGTYPAILMAQIEQCFSRIGFSKNPVFVFYHAYHAHPSYHVFFLKQDVQLMLKYMI